MEPIENAVFIEGVHLHVDAVKDQKPTKEFLRQYFDHLAPKKQDAAIESLWALVKDKEIPENAAPVTIPEAPAEVKEEPAAKSKAK